MNISAHSVIPESCIGGNAVALLNAESGTLHIREGIDPDLDFTIADYKTHEIHPPFHIEGRSSSP